MRRRRKKRKREKWGVEEKERGRRERGERMVEMEACSLVI